MFRPMLVLVLFVALASGAFAQTKKPAVTSGKPPTEKDKSIVVNVFMRDAAKNEVLVATRIWPGYPDYNALALARFFAVMKALEPQYTQDDEVAYTWGTKGKVTKCSIYLESFEAGAKGGTGSVVGCEANGVSGIPVTSLADTSKKTVSSSSDPRHQADVLDLFKRQSDRAKQGVPKG